MKCLSKSKQVSAILGASLLVLAACAPDSLTRGGSTQPAPADHSNDNSAALNANETGAPAAASPLQNETEFTGPIEVLASNMWVVGGRTVAVTAATEIKPGLEVGMPAKVHAVRQADGSLWARAVEPASDSSNVNSNDNNGNNNDNDNVNSNNDNENNNDNTTGNVSSNDDNVNNNDKDNRDHNDDAGDENSNDDYGNNNDNGNVNSNDDNRNNNDNDAGNVNSNDDHGNNNDNDNGNVNSNHDNRNNNDDDVGNENHNDDHGVDVPADVQVVQIWSLMADNLSLSSYVGSLGLLNNS